MNTDKLVWVLQGIGRRLPASPDRLDAEMRSLRFMQDSLVKTITDELKALHNVVEEVQLVVKQSSVSDACVIDLQVLILTHSLAAPCER